jgi:hypothetical protein
MEFVVVVREVSNRNFRIGVHAKYKILPSLLSHSLDQFLGQIHNEVHHVIILDMLAIQHVLLLAMEDKEMYVCTHVEATYCFS